MATNIADPREIADDQQMEEAAVIAAADATSALQASLPRPGNISAIAHVSNETGSTPADAP